MQSEWEHFLIMFYADSTINKSYSPCIKEKSQYWMSVYMYILFKFQIYKYKTTS